MFQYSVFKRTISIALVLSMISLFLESALASGEITKGNYRYRIMSDGTAEITKYIGYDTVAMTIPEQIDGYVVTSIGNYAFMYAPISSLTIGDKVTKIGEAAFFGCDAETVSISSLDLVIGKEAFSCCSSIETFSLSANNVEIGESAFMYTKPLKSFKWQLADEKAQNTITIIGDNAFFSSGIIEITIPGDELKIGDNAFGCCSSIKSMTALCKNISIGESAFMYAEFEEFSIPNNLVGEGNMKIGDNAFFSCGLHKFIIPASINKIGNQAFSCSSNLEEVTIPPTVTSIGKDVFLLCDSSLVARVVEGSYADEYCKKNRISCEFISEYDLSNIYNENYVESLANVKNTAVEEENPNVIPRNEVPSNQGHKEYTYMYDKWNLYKAVFISDYAMKIERWNRWNAGEDGDPFEYEYDVCVINIADGTTDFMWMDEEQTAFNMTFIDEKNSNIEEATMVGFAVNYNDIKDFKEYSYMNDKWNLYRAFELSDTAIKIEKWSRFDAGEDGDPFTHDSDICVIQVGSSYTDFKWTDNTHVAFTLTMLDDNNGYWDDEKTVPFSLTTNEETMPLYSYQNDKWNLYKAFRMSDTTIKIERWTRFDAGVDGDPFKHENDVCVIKIIENTLDFAWCDEEEAAFTITMIDETNNYWDDKIRVPFGIENNKDSYKRFTYQNDKWNLYVAIMLSDNTIKIEDWTRFNAGENGDPFRREYDVLILDSEKNSPQFKWVDADHTAFRFYMQDNKNRYWNGEQEVTFVIDNSLEFDSVSEGESEEQSSSTSTLVDSAINGIPVVKGIYTVGRDIQPGSYSLTMLSCRQASVVATFSNEETLSSYTSWDSAKNLGRYAKTAIYVQKDQTSHIYLEDGDYLYIGDGSGVIVVGDNNTLIRGVYKIGKELSPGSYTITLNEVNSSSVVATFANSSDLVNYTSWDSANNLQQYSIASVYANSGEAFNISLYNCEYLYISDGTGTFVINESNELQKDVEDIFAEEFYVEDSVEQEYQSIKSTFPIRSIWGLSKKTFREKYPADYKTTVVGKADALVLENINIENWIMNVYYVFNNEGLSKITYILEGKDPSTNKECVSDLIYHVEESIGKATHAEKAVNQWDEEDFSLKIGTARLKNYTGSNDKMATMLFNKPDSTAKTVSSTKPEELVIGTYVGENGSTLVIFNDGTAEYYWKEWNSPFGDNKWEIKDGKIIIDLKCVYCIVNAEIPNGEISELLIKSDSAFWDDEKYYYVSKETKHLTQDEAMRIIEEKLGKNDLQLTDYDENNSNLNSDIKMTNLTTGHFNISVPANWEYSQNEQWHYYYGQEEQYGNCFLGIWEDDELYEKTHDLNTEDAYGALDMLTNQISESVEDNAGHLNVNGMPAVNFKLTNSEATVFDTILVFDQGYFLCVSYSDESNNYNLIHQNAMRFFETIATERRNIINYDSALMNPTENYIIQHLQRASNVSVIAPVTEEHDPNNQLGKQGGYTSAIYFSSPFVTELAQQMSTFEVIEEGTSCGGCIEVFSTVEDAERRETYLRGFGTMSGSSKVVGTCIIRISNELTASKQKELEQDVIDALNER